MYAKIVDNAVVQYPYGITRLRNENPNISFPVNFLDHADAINYNVVVVKEVPRPVKAGFAYSDIGPSLIDGVWTQVWEERRKEISELLPSDITQVEEPVTEGFYALDAGPSWDGVKYVQTWNEVAMSPVEKRIKEYGSPEDQLEYIVENGVDAFITRQDAIKTKYPKS